MNLSRGCLYWSTRCTKKIRRPYSSFSQAVQDPNNPIQSYVSSSTDPFINLSIEHYLLQKSHQDSAILFLYANHPCVVIGRNQNPWQEVNLHLLHESAENASSKNSDYKMGRVELVRRRSGGGTVFHDSGNLNWSVICNPSTFTRDKHGQMIVKALHRLGVSHATLNERHDIVLTQYVPGSEQTSVRKKPLKVSGSAYKLTRTRALHHGTCLLSSPNLSVIPQYLRSPSKAYLKSKGVESVSSPIANIGIPKKDFQMEVFSQFCQLYQEARVNQPLITVGSDLLDIPEINAGVSELNTVEWKYEQTPMFTIFSKPIYPHLAAHDPRQSMDFQNQFSVSVRHGKIIQAKLNSSEDDRLSPDLDYGQLVQLHDVRLKDIESFIRSKGGNYDSPVLSVAKWLQSMLPVPMEPR